jgi:hypothetical protein
MGRFGTDFPPYGRDCTLSVMIRRQVGEEYWLITQDDHARLAGQLSRHFGNKSYDPPSCEAAYQGITLHDCGWPLHDEHPTLNAQGQPLDVFESPRQVTLPVWERSAELAMQAHAYAGLLVSIHVLWLSMFASRQTGAAAQSWDLTQPRARFEVNRFQHRMIEIQEMLRKQLGMHTDLPLKNGLAEQSSDPAEKRLIADFWRLQAMDVASLAICCTHPPFETHRDLSLHFGRDGNDLLVERWPFGEPKFEVAVPFRRIPARRYTDAADLGRAMDESRVETFTVTTRPNKI